MEQSYLDKTYTVSMDAFIAGYIETKHDENDWEIFQCVKKAIILCHTMPVSRVSFSIVTVLDFPIEIIIAINKRGYNPDTVYVFKAHSDIWKETTKQYRIKFKRAYDDDPEMVVIPC